MDLKLISVEKAFSREKRHVFIDRDRLYEVFLNVLLNAIQAISRKGEINISTKIFSPGSGKKTSEQLLISVTDTGMGMEKPLRTQAFKPFYTTRKDGTGMGLSICGKHIDKHGGRMELTGEKGSGTTVNIYLPIADNRV